MVDGVEWIAKRSFYLFQLFNKNICEHQNSQRASHSTATTFIFSLRVSPKNTHKNRLKMKKKPLRNTTSNHARKKKLFLSRFSLSAISQTRAMGWMKHMILVHSLRFAIRAAHNNFIAHKTGKFFS